MEWTRLFRRLRHLSFNLTHKQEDRRSTKDALKILRRRVENSPWQIENPPQEEQMNKQVVRLVAEITNLVKAERALGGTVFARLALIKLDKIRKILQTRIKDPL